MSSGTRHQADAESGTPRRPRLQRAWRLGLVGLVVTFVALAAIGLAANSGAISLNAAGSAKPGAPSATRTATSPSEAAPTAPTTAASPSLTPVVSTSPPPASTSPVPATSTASSPAAQPLGVSSIAAYGPEGMADGDNPGAAAQILNVTSSQPWYTQWYATPQFGVLRTGTGLMLDLGKSVTVADVRLVLGSEPGADVQVRVGDSPAVDLAVAATAADVGGTVKLTVPTPVTGRYVLIWFTRLPPDSLGHYQVKVYDVTVDGI